MSELEERVDPVRRAGRNRGPIPADAVYPELAGYFRVMVDRVLTSPRSRAATDGDVASGLGISASTLSRHLAGHSRPERAGMRAFQRWVAEETATPLTAEEAERGLTLVYATYDARHDRLLIRQFELDALQERYRVEQAATTRRIADLSEELAQAHRTREEAELHQAQADTAWASRLAQAEQRIRELERDLTQARALARLQEADQQRWAQAAADTTAALAALDTDTTPEHPTDDARDPLLRRIEKLRHDGHHEDAPALLHAAATERDIMELPLLALTLEAGTTVERHQDVPELLQHAGRLQPIPDIARLIAVAHNRATSSPTLDHSRADGALRRISKEWAAPLLRGVAMRTPADVIDLAELLIGKRLVQNTRLMFIACNVQSSEVRLRELLIEARSRLRNADDTHSPLFAVLESASVGLPDSTAQERWNKVFEDTVGRRSPATGPAAVEPPPRRRRFLGRG
ncbi:hypothetical protein OG948_34840 (plasmid) [Embleya sp. NBC_00888]|uniref:hypothetical protein n=1 Tax=Embleya sp. NBC_00888 TaxID=2975960 RepID=UPI002F91677E|nr:hypothetical protein OG948_34840 [Embleya sp. NBC_00888]